MPETDIILGDDDVEVRAANLSVFNDDGDSGFRADVVEPSGAVKLVSDDGDRSLTLTAGSLLWQNEENRTLEIHPGQVRLPRGVEDSTSMIADIINARTELRSSDVNAESAHFADGTVGGNPWGTEEPQAGRVEVLDEGTDRTILLDGSRGVVETSGGDVAEYFPNGTDRTFDGGEVVGLRDGAVTDAVGECDEGFVVASTPMLLGNRPPDADSVADETDHVPVALLGQVPVRIADDVSAGDRLVATADGRAVPADDGDDDAPTVGRAIESATASDGTTTALVGYSPSRPSARGPRSNGSDVEARVDDLEAANRELEAALAERDDRIDDLAADNETLQAENEALRERLRAVEDRLAAAEDRPADAADGLADIGSAGATPVDD